METRIILNSLLFLILNIGSTVVCGDNSLINDEVLHKTDNVLMTENYQKNSMNNNACTYDNGKDPNIRKNIEEIMKVLVKDSLPLAMETLDEQEYDIARDIQVAANEVIIELALHASKITQKILQSMKKSNDTQAAINTKTNHCALADKISLLKELTNIINMNNIQQSESIAILNNHITSLENLNSSNTHEMDVLASTENNQKSVTKHSEPGNLKPNVVEENVEKVSFLCDIKVPDSIVNDPDVWKYEQIPEKDDLDIFMINKTGCSYLALAHYHDHVLKPVTYTGQLEWRVAVRAGGQADMDLEWKRSRFNFHVGEKNNTVSRLYEYESGESWTRPAPGVPAEDRYVTIYYKINNGKLTAGLECEPEPWFTRDVALEMGQEIQRSVSAGSRFGVKYLYDCPSSFTDKLNLTKKQYYTNETIQTTTNTNGTTQTTTNTNGTTQTTTNTNETAQTTTNTNGTTQTTTNTNGTTQRTTNKNGTKQATTSRNEQKQDTREIESDKNEFITSLCEAAAPGAVDSGWEENKEPEVDDYDIFMVNKTGCRYTSPGIPFPFVRNYSTEVAGPGEGPGAGARFQWRGAVRVRAATDQVVAIERVLWGERDGVFFEQFLNGTSGMSEWPKWNTLESRDTPGLLAPGRYMPLTITVQSGCVSLVAGCGARAGEPLFSRCAASLEHARLLQLMISSYPHHSTKLLYDCPAL